MTDTIVASYDSPELIKFSGGNLLIENYNYDDTLQIASGSIKNYSTDGGDLILNISGGGSVTLKNMTNHAITTANSKGKASTKIYGNGYSPLEVIHNFMRSIRYSASTDNNQRLDEAIRACSNFNSIQDVVDQMISDRKRAADANTFLEDYCGIILGNSDTGAITGWDAGGLVAYDVDSIMVETLPADTLSSFNNVTYSKGGLNVTYNQKDKSLSSGQKKILQGAYSWWVEESAALIEQSYGIAFDDLPVTLNAINKSTAKYWGSTVHKSSGDVVSLNLKYTYFNGKNNLDANSVDRCLAHELTHVAQNAYLMKFPQFMSEGMAELTGGVDDQRVGSITKVASSVDSLSAYLDLSNYKTGNKYYYAAGYMFWRYLAKQASDACDSSKTYAFSENALLKGTSKADLLTAWGAGLTINGGKGNDTINALGSNAPHVYEFGSSGGRDVVLGYSSGDTIHILDGAEYSTVRSGNDVIVKVGKARMTLKDAKGQKLKIVGRVVNSKNGVKLNGTAFDEYIINSGVNVTINGGKGNDTIIGSAHADVFQFSYASGNDVITNFGASDTIKSTAGTMSYKRSGDDYVVTIKKNSTSATITLLDAANDYTLQKSGSTIKVKAQKNSSAQEATDAGYWFIEESTNESPLSEIVEQESAIDLSTDFMAETLERKMDALIGVSRHRLKK